MYIQITTVAQVEEKLFLLCGLLNEEKRLFCIDLKEKTVNYKESFDEGKCSGSCYLYALLYGEEICFIPYVGKQLILYNTVTGAARYVFIDEIKSVICDVFIEGDILYLLLQQSSNTVLKYDLKNDKIYGHLELSWRQFLKETGYTKQQFMMEQPGSLKGCRCEDIWWISLGSSGIILQLDYKNDFWKTHYIEELKNQRLDSFRAGGKIWVKLHGKNEFLEYDYKNNEKIWISFPHTKEDELGITLINDCGEYILFTNNNGNIIVFHKASKRFSVFTCKGNCLYYRSVHYNGKELIFPQAGRDVIVYDPEKDEIQTYPLYYDEKIITKSLFLRQNRVVREDFCKLSEFLEMIEDDSGADIQNESIGKSVWELLKTELC